MTFLMQGLSWIMANDEELMVLRREGGLGQTTTYVSGKLVRQPGTLRAFQCRGNVQPLNGKDLELLPEGDRFDDQLWLFSNQDSEPLQVEDNVFRNGKIYQVQSCEEWGSYNRARLMLDDKLPNLS